MNLSNIFFFLVTVGLFGASFAMQGDIPFMIRSAVACLLGALIGVERARAHKQAGVRTFALVALGASTFSLIGAISPLEGQDPTRIVSQIVVGISFLGAGVILLQQDKVVGLTTAAGLWVTAAIGALAGFGLYPFAFFVTALAIVIFHYLPVVEDRVRNSE